MDEEAMADPQLYGSGDQAVLNYGGLVWFRWLPSFQAFQSCMVMVTTRYR